jgi:hypothetical protein
MKALTNFLMFQAGWFATVLGAANGAPWIGPVVVLAIVAIHLRSARRPQSEALLVASAVALGLVADSLLLATGWIAYPNGGWVPGLAPYWIVGLWALFATTLNVSMGWLSGRMLLAALFGAIGGPLSYLAGARLGAMTFVDTTAAVIALAVCWAMMMPILMKLAAYFDRPDRRSRPAYILDEWRQVDSHG